MRCFIASLIAATAVASVEERMKNSEAFFSWELDNTKPKPADVSTDTVSLVNTLADTTKASYKADLVYNFSPSSYSGYLHAQATIAGGAAANWEVGSMFVPVF
jgi:hypothetical protein